MAKTLTGTGAPEVARDHDVISEGAKALPRPDMFEPRADFIDRCMIDGAILATYNDELARVSACSTLYDEFNNTVSDAARPQSKVDDAGRRHSVRLIR
jgi:hypothetical protein